MNLKGGERQSEQFRQASGKAGICGDDLHSWIQGWNVKCDANGGVILFICSVGRWDYILSLCVADTLYIQSLNWGDIQVLELLVFVMNEKTLQSNQGFVLLLSFDSYFDEFVVTVD